MWTYTTLKTAIEEYLETDETTFVSNIPNIVKQAEDRILKQVQLPDFRKNVTGTMTDGTRYLEIPTDFLAPYSLALNNSGYEYLIFKDVNFIREVYPDPAVEGTPRYYSIFDDTYFLLGPTPDSNYATELHYFHRPQSIVDGSTSWLGTNAPSTLLSVCLHEAYVFLKGDPDLMQKYKEQAEEAIMNLKVLGEGRNTTDSYRSF